MFERTLGEVSDIVTKEMYSFEDKGGDRIMLRRAEVPPNLRLPRLARLAFTLDSTMSVD